jgi:hypothetical protein
VRGQGERDRESSERTDDSDADDAED